MYLTTLVYSAITARQIYYDALMQIEHNGLNKTAFCYILVSTARQTEGESLDVQLRQIELVADLGNYFLETVFVEAGQSGSKPLAKRPEGAKAR
jgi:hypothetical protein